MATMGAILAGLGVIAMVLGGIWMLVEQFKTGILWGLACIFLPVVSLIWLATHWREGHAPFFLSLIGAASFLGGLFMQGAI